MVKNSSKPNAGKNLLVESTLFTGTYFSRLVSKQSITRIIHLESLKFVSWFIPRHRKFLFTNK